MQHYIYNREKCGQTHKTSQIFTPSLKSYCVYSGYIMLVRQFLEEQPDSIMCY